MNDKKQESTLLATPCFDELDTEPIEEEKSMSPRLGTKPSVIFSSEPSKRERDQNHLSLADNDEDCINIKIDFASDEKCSPQERNLTRFKF